MKARKLAIVAVMLTSAGCLHLDPYTWVDELDETAYEPEPYRIGSGDGLHIIIWNQAELTGDVRVRPDGNITLALVGDVSVAGLTPDDAAASIKKRLDGIVLEPNVSVAVREGRQSNVSVVGEVRTPGQYNFNKQETVLHVLAKAGGLTEFAQPDAVFVVRSYPDRARVRFHYDKLSRGVGRSLEFQLRDGDVIVVE
jgi:polysaccharide biosynthesis/export protein